jgi:hypothetical protein
MLDATGRRDRRAAGTDQRRHGGEDRYALDADEQLGRLGSHG